MARVTMQEVAARAGVSAQTVSRVWRQSPLVSDQTRRKVQEAISALHYVGNTAASSLKSGHAKLLGYVAPAPSSPFFSEVALAVERAARERGYAVLLCDTGDDAACEEDYLRILHSHRVRGIVYVEPSRSAPSTAAAAALLQAGIPIVTISADLADVPGCHVRTDDRRAGYVATRHLLDLGHTRIALVSRAIPHLAALGYAGIARQPFHDRWAGYVQALAEHPLAPDPQLMVVVPPTLDGGMAATRQLLAQPQPPTAIVCTLDILALGALEVLVHEKGCRVPDDIAVIGHDGLPAGALYTPALTTVVPPKAAMGRTCVEILFRQLDGARDLPRLTMLDATFVVRESTVGRGARARRGYATPLSAADAWRQWRSESDEAREPAAAAVARLPEEVASSF